MGMLALKRLMSRQRRRQVQARNGSVTSMSRTNRRRQADSNSRRVKQRLRYSGPNLPERAFHMLVQDIWHHIHSLMPLRDAARAACVSRTFVCSWRCHPNLIFTKKTPGLKRSAFGNGDAARAFTSKVDQILKNHSGIGVKTFKLDIFDCCNLSTCYLDNWLQIAITPGIETLKLLLPLKYKEGYSFPCSLLYGRSASSLQYLHLTYCAFRPTVGLGCLRSLTELCLRHVRIAEEELGCLLSSSFALEQIELWDCSEITCLKIPCVLERLSSLYVRACRTLQMIESKAPNLSTFDYEGDLVQLSLGQSKVKNLQVDCLNECNLLCYAITILPDIVPNLQKLTLSSIGEEVNTPMGAAKFLQLKDLKIYVDGDLSPAYDYLSLVSFLDASPVLETFILYVDQREMMFDSVFGDASHMRRMPENQHDSLKTLMIFGFCSAKSMVELTCHILENAASLECVTMDTVFDPDDEDDIGRCCVASARKTGECIPLCDGQIWEANIGLMAIEGYIVEKVPSTVKLNVRGPCSRCHILGL